MSTSCTSPEICGETHLRTALSVIDGHWLLRRQLTLAANLNHDGLGRVNREDRVAGLGLRLGRQPCIRVATAARDDALHLIWAGPFGRAVVAILSPVSARPILIEHTEPRDLDIGPGLGQRLSAQQKCREGCSSPHSCQESVQQPYIVGECTIHYLLTIGINVINQSTSSTKSGMKRMMRLSAQQKCREGCSSPHSC